MVRINNSDLSFELRDVAKIQAGIDIIPNIMSNQVVPVIDVNPKHARILNVAYGVSTSASGTSTIYTTPSDKPLYLTSIGFSYVKDAACDAATGAMTIRVTINGAALNIIVVPIITLTAQSGIYQINLPKPMLLDRNSNITMAATFAAGVMSRAGYITGYTLDNVNA